jgi:hypothetical protein
MQPVTKWLKSWGIPILGAILVVMVGFGLLVAPEIPRGMVLEDRVGAGGVLLADLEKEEEDRALRGELTLKDPTPLFLPTIWNSGQVDRTMTTERSSGASFGQIEAKWVFPDDENRLVLPDGVAVPESAITTIDQIEERLSGGELARRDVSARPLEKRTGYLEVIAVETGETVYSRVLRSGGDEGETIEVPVETILAINQSGFWLRPTVAEVAEGGAVEFDRVNLLLRETRLETVLEPGFYRILLGP